MGGQITNNSYLSLFCLCIYKTSSHSRTLAEVWSPLINRMQKDMRCTGVVSEAHDVLRRERVLEFLVNVLAVLAT